MSFKPEGGILSVVSLNGLDFSHSFEMTIRDLNLMI